MLSSKYSGFIGKYLLVVALGLMSVSSTAKGSSTQTDYDQLDRYILSDNFDEAQELLKALPTLATEKNGYGNTILDRAIEVINPRMVQLLLNSGATINRRGQYWATETIRGLQNDQSTASAPVSDRRKIANLQIITRLLNGEEIPATEMKTATFVTGDDEAAEMEALYSRTSAGHTETNSFDSSVAAGGSGESPSTLNEQIENFMPEKQALLLSDPSLPKLSDLGLTDGSAYDQEKLGAKHREIVAYLQAEPLDKKRSFMLKLLDFNETETPNPSIPQIQAQYMAIKTPWDKLTTEARKTNYQGIDSNKFALAEDVELTARNVADLLIYQIEKSAAVNIQKLHRGHQARRNARAVRAAKKEASRTTGAATKIQSTVRMKKAQKQYKKMKNDKKMQNAARKIQNVGRGFLRRNRAKEMREQVAREAALASPTAAASSPDSKMRPAAPFTGSSLPTPSMLGRSMMAAGGGYVTQRGGAASEIDTSGDAGRLARIEAVRLHGHDAASTLPPHLQTIVDNLRKAAFNKMMVNIRLRNDGITDPTEKAAVFNALGIKQ